MDQHAVSLRDWPVRVGEKKITPAPFLATPCRSMACCNIYSRNKMNHYPPVWWYRLTYLVPFIACIRRLRGRKLHGGAVDAIIAYIKKHHRVDRREICPNWLSRMRIPLRLIRRNRTASLSSGLQESQSYYYELKVRLRAIQHPYHALWTSFELTHEKGPMLGDEVQLKNGIVGVVERVDTSKKQMLLSFRRTRPGVVGPNGKDGATREWVPLLSYQHTILKNVNPGRVILQDAYGFDGARSGQRVQEEEI